jgi:hypothetical protein
VKRIGDCLNSQTTGTFPDARGGLRERIGGLNTKIAEIQAVVKGHKENVIHVRLTRLLVFFHDGFNV